MRRNNMVDAADPTNLRCRNGSPDHQTARVEATSRRRVLEHACARPATTPTAPLALA